MNKPIALHGWVLSRNFGDMLMLDMARAWVLDAEGGPVSVPLGRPEVTGELGVEPATGLAGLLESRGLIIPGGGGFGMRPQGGWRQRVNMLRRLTGPLFVEALQNKPFSLVGIGAGPFGGRLDGRVITALFDRAEFVSVRDEESLTYLRAAGLRRLDIEVTADIVLSLRPSMLPQAAESRATELLSGLAGRQKVLGVHLSDGPNTADYSAVHMGVVEAASAYPEVGLALLIDHPSQGSDSGQVRAAQALKQHFQDRAVVLDYVDHWTLASVLGRLSGVVTNKLHVAITAMALGNPAIAITKHPKNHRLFKQLNIPDQCLDLMGVQAEEVRRLVNELLFSDQNARFEVPAAVRRASEQNKTVIQRLARLP